MLEITRPPRLGWRPLAGLAMLVFAVAFGGWQLARAEERSALDTRFTELTAIGQLKVHQITEWRSERLRGARMLAHEPLFAALASRWAAAPDDAAAQREVKAHLAVLHRDLGYGDAILATPDGARWMSAAGDHERLHAETQRIMNESAASGDAILSDFYRCPDCGTVHIEAAGPIVTEAGRVAAILVLRSDPQLTLYPLLRQWPTTSNSAETLLVRREGSEVVFLNSLRDARGPLTVRLPLSRRAPATAAAKGETGRFEGADYRGVQVIADVRPVPDSPWFMVVKVDLEEALREGRFRSRAIAVGVVLGVGLLTAFWASLMRRRQRDAYRALYEAELQRQAAQAHDHWLSSILERSVNEIYVFDSQTLRFSYVNGAALSQLGYTADEMRGMTLLDIKPDMTADRFAALMALLRDGRQRLVEYETVHRKKGGATYDVLAVLQMIEAPGGREFVVVALDITERKRLESQLQHAQRLEAVGRLAGGVAHDFNNLLAVINNYADFGLEALPPGHPFRADLQEIRTAGERAANLTRQLLAFSRKQVLQPQPINLNDVVGSIKPMLGRLIGEDIDLVTVLSPGLRNTVADRGQLEQVIMNLAVNARDAMPHGGVLTIETANADLDAEFAARHGEVVAGPHVMLAVSDTGVGMDEEVRKHLFEPFFTTKPIGKGTGLGLAMIYGIVKQSGGNIWASSEVGRGTTFKVYLPATAEATRAVAIAPSSLARARPGETVLIVEDEAAVRNLARRILEGAGYAVLVGLDAPQSRPIWGDAGVRIDLLLTDVVMPQVSGRQLAAEMRQARPGLRVLYMSGYTEDAIVHQGVLEPGIHFIPKPFTAAELASKVRQAIDDSSEPDAANAEPATSWPPAS